jgi:RNA polymerase sigma factor (sigma-70 family)
MEPRGDPSSLGVVDVATVRGAQRGDPTALNDLVRQVSPYVGRLCAAIALQDAEDAMQESLTAIVKGVPSLREPRAFKAWARRITVREAVRVARRSRPTETLDENLAVAAMTIDDSVDVQLVLARLRPDQRAVLVLRDLDGFSELEVASLLDIPPGTVKSRLHRARTAFAQRWQE